MKNPKKDSLFRELFYFKQEKKERKSFYEDIRSIYEFYLTPSEQAKLKNMGWFKRLLFRSFWFLKNIMSKLSVSRRFLLVISLFFLFSSQDESRFYLAYGVVGIILLLELKDKLLAHDELKAGRAVQEAMRPQKSPSLIGWEVFLFSQSANEVGGDLIDHYETEDSRRFFMVGDVSGKGLGAALLMAQLQASVEALLSHIPKLAHLTAQLNKLYCRSDLDNCFISFIILQILNQKGDINYVNAGHLPPILLRKGRALELDKGEPALGLSRTTAYRQKSLTMIRDDILVVYTDGVTEARNENGDFYGEDRFFHLLEALPDQAAHDIGRQIIDDVVAFCGQAQQNDDVTLMILKRTGDN